jgi:hypothetical protein
VVALDGGGGKEERQNGADSLQAMVCGSLIFALVLQANLSARDSTLSGKREMSSGGRGVGRGAEGVRKQGRQLRTQQQGKGSATRLIGTRTFTDCGCVFPFIKWS